MTNTEFIFEFDLLFNNIMSGAAPGINDYEKSVLLTKAQEEIIKNYLNPLGNKYQEGLDDSNKRIIDFSGLVKTAKITNTVSVLSIDSRAVSYRMPADTFIPTNEVLRGRDSNNVIRDYQIITISNKEYTRLMSKPYKKPLKNQAWKFATEGSDSQIATIVPHSSVTNLSYIIRYLKRPNPIILRNLATIETELGLTSGTLSINGIRTVSSCELSPSIHREILDRAVELAKASYTDNVSALTQINSRNE